MNVLYNIKFYIIIKIKKLLCFFFVHAIRGTFIFLKSKSLNYLQNYCTLNDFVDTRFIAYIFLVQEQDVPGLTLIKQETLRTKR